MGRDLRQVDQRDQEVPTQNLTSHISYEAFESVILNNERNLNNRPLTYVEAEGGEEEVLTPIMILWGRDAYPVEDTEGSEAEKLTRMTKRLEDAKTHVWKRWKREYMHSLMESHWLNKERGSTPKVGEIVLVVGDEKNRGEWKKGKVVRLIEGRDGVVRGVTLLHKGCTIERPLQLVCPLEIRAAETFVQPHEGRREGIRTRRQPKQAAAQKAVRRIAEQLHSEDD